MKTLAWRRPANRSGNIKTSHYDYNRLFYERIRH